MSRHTKTFHSEMAIQHLINASRAARRGDAKEASSYFEEADKSIEQHVNYLRSIGNHDEAEHAQKTYAKQKKIMLSAHKFNVKSVKNIKAKKSDFDESGEGQFKKVSEGIFLKAETVKLGQSGNPRYEYKGLHELNPEDRQRVLGRAGNRPMYPGKEHHKFLYPTDSSGSLVHSGRVAAPASHDFAAAHASMQESEFKGKKLSEGQGVRMNQPGHELHGKLGVVQPPHPSFPDKIHVMFQGGRREFLDHSMVNTSKPGEQVKKAKSTVIDIRSRLDKKNNKN